jgi:hypothetical protein
VRAASRAPGDGEALDSELVGDGGNIRDAVHHPAAAMTVRAAVAGPVVGDHPSADLDVGALIVVPSES